MLYSVHFSGVPARIVSAVGLFIDKNLDPFYNIMCITVNDTRISTGTCYDVPGIH